MRSHVQPPHAGGMGGSSTDALSAGLAPARFGSDMAASGISAAIKNCLRGRALHPRKEGFRSYVSHSTPREGAQELPGWETAEVTERVYVKGRSEEAAFGDARGCVLHLRHPRC